MLRDLIRRGEEAAAPLTAAKGTTKAGRNKACRQSIFRPRTFCAAIVREASIVIHGVEPAPRNQKAAAAADLF